MSAAKPTRVEPRSTAAPLVEVRGLVKTFAVGGGWRARRVVRAVDGVDLEIGRGEIVGLVGESGSGKTTLGRAVLRLTEPSAGTVHFAGTDLLAQRPRALRRLRRRMQIVFQDPSAALNPRMKVRALVGEPLAIHGVARGRTLAGMVRELLVEVGLDPSAADRYPDEFSGGQKQRIGIARAIGLRPDFVVCDEPVSALDVSVQAQVVNLLADLQRRHGMAYLFIAHDLAVVSHLADRVAVMYLGRIVEEAPAAGLRALAAHPYTQALYERAVLPGEMPSPVDVPSGCRFHTRCPHAQPVCRREDPPLLPFGPEPGRRRVACHFADTLARTIKRT